MTDLFIADVSQWQPDIDGHAYMAAGHPIIIVRAHSGHAPDKLMPVRRDYLRKCGFAGIGWYQYLAAGRGPATQAREFLATVGPLRANEWVILDCEEGTGNQTEYAKAWFDEVDGATGRPAMLYSGSSFLNTSLGGTGPWRGRPLWIAAYGPHEPIDAHLLWQYSDGKDHGAPYKPINFSGIGLCDASVHHGSAEDFLSAVLGESYKPATATAGQRPAPKAIPEIAVASAPVQSAPDPDTGPSPSEPSWLARLEAFVARIEAATASMQPGKTEPMQQSAGPGFPQT